MGHHLSSKSSIIPLIERLNKYPVGLVDNEKLREILSILFEEKEAFVASMFPLEEATLPELINVTDMPEDELLPILERMADKGLIMDMPYSGTTYYLLMPGLIGFMEFTFMKSRVDLPMAKLAKLMTEYLSGNSKDGMANEFFGSSTQLTRSLVYEDKIPVTSEITTYENAREIIKNASFGAVGTCYCRHKKEHLDQKCKKGAPVKDTCITLGSGARFLVRRGFATQKTTEELLAIIDMARDLNLTHVTDNIRNKPSFVCNCCRCCCELMSGVQMGFTEGIAKTAFLARIDPEKCDYCGDCFKACNVKAIGLAKGRVFARKSDRFSEIEKDICLGCGACISTCDKNAISLVPRERKIVPPENKRKMFARILWEKGKLSPFLLNRGKKIVRSIFGMRG
ncbi:MAG: 4Fe-4S ferredoxin [Nitrospinota bacterium]|nr:4Fe-4S ferredoxin [Nitrospinota bacterium]